jgi:hypothetical protein
MEIVKKRLWVFWMGILSLVLSGLITQFSTLLEFSGLTCILFSQHRIAIGILCFFLFEIHMIGYINSHGQSKTSLHWMLLYGAVIIFFVWRWWRRDPKPPPDGYSG